MTVLTKPVDLKGLIVVLMMALKFTFFMAIFTL
jgi:hypothetical protein